MREPKFRAWDNTSKDIGGQRMIGWEELDQLDKDDLIAFMDVARGKTKDVILLQYTGLKDKQGKEIYDGDLVRYKWSHTLRAGRIEWSFTRFWAVDDPRALDRWAYSRSNEMEVIGNIWENPEALK